MTARGAGARATLTTVGVLVAALLGGCAGGAGPGGPGSPAPPASSAPGAPSAAPTPTAPTASPPVEVTPRPPLDPNIPSRLPSPRPKWPVTLPPGKPTTGSLTLTGTVTEGVESGCLLLHGYLLVNAPTDVVRSGARVRVTGKIRPDLSTTCMQGIPLEITSASRA